VCLAGCVRELEWARACVWRSSTLRYFEIEMIPHEGDIHFIETRRTNSQNNAQIFHGKWEISLVFHDTCEKHSSTN
jgi:hypothetical protein